jgi:hypothetical protein
VACPDKIKWGSKVIFVVVGGDVSAVVCFTLRLCAQVNGCNFLSTLMKNVCVFANAAADIQDRIKLAAFNGSL